jgi:2-iminobutanoate/2-iminopropanoate deaminase
MEVHKMEKVVIHTDRAGEPGGHYSQAIRFGQFVFTAGAVGKDPSTGKVVGGIRAQVRQALENIRAVLAEAGTSLEHVLKANAYLRDIGDFTAFNEVYSEYFDAGPPPARTTVGVSFAGDVDFEIDVIAFVDS